VSAGAVTIREARAADAEQLAELARELAGSEGGIPERISAEWIGANMLAPDGPTRLMVAENGARLVGYVAASPMVETIFASPGSYVGDLIVTEGWRGRGIGRRLLAAIAQDARSRGLKHLWLVTGNKDAERFYRGIANIRQEVVGFAFADETFSRLADAGLAELPEAKPQNDRVRT
jgi:ribosomal protein S18 acetylase RimI-like enzyme